MSIHQRHEEQANVSLIRAGVIGCSPMQPTTAVTIECLELYHQLRRRQSSFSTQAMVKTLCALNNVGRSLLYYDIIVIPTQITYAQHLRVQFAVAFDIYLDIRRRISQALNEHLGREGRRWKMQGACPCCAFAVSA